LTWAEVKQGGNHATRDKEKQLCAKLVNLVEQSGSVVHECRLYFEPGSGGDVVAKAALLAFMNQKKATVLCMHKFKTSDSFLDYIKEFYQDGKRLLLYCDTAYDGGVSALKQYLERNQIKAVLFSIHKGTDAHNQFFNLPEYFESEVETKLFYQFYLQRCAPENKSKFVAKYGKSTEECAKLWRQGMAYGKTAQSDLIYFSPVFMCLFAKEADFQGIESYVSRKLEPFRENRKELEKYAIWMTLVSFVQSYGDSEECSSLVLKEYCLKTAPASWDIVDQAKLEFPQNLPIRESFDIFCQSNNSWKTRHIRIALEVLKYFKTQWKMPLRKVASNFIQCFKRNYPLVSTVFFGNVRRPQGMKFGPIMHDTGLSMVDAESLFITLTELFPKEPYVIANHGRFISEIKENHNEAEQKIKEALAKFEEVGGKDNQKNSTILNMLGVVYQRWLLNTELDEYEKILDLFSKASNTFDHAREVFMKNKHAYISYVFMVTQFVEKVNNSPYVNLTDYLVQFQDASAVKNCVSEADDILEQYKHLFIKGTQDENSDSSEAISISQECRSKLDICRSTIQNLEETLREEASKPDSDIAKYYYITQMLKLRKNFKDMFSKAIHVAQHCVDYTQVLLQSNQLSSFRINQIYSYWFRLVRFIEPEVTASELSALVQQWKEKAPEFGLAAMYESMLHLQDYLLSNSNGKPRHSFCYTNFLFLDDEIEYLVSIQSEKASNLKNFAHKEDSDKPNLAWIKRHQIKLTLMSDKGAEKKAVGPFGIYFRLFSRFNPGTIVQSNTSVNIQLAFSRCGPIVKDYQEK
jgi:hypothetical protein